MEKDKRLQEEGLQSEEVFNGRLLHVRRDTVRLPDGKTSTREWIRHPGASAVLPVFPNGDVLLIRQFRYPCRRVFLEVPAGKIDPGEKPDETARREIEEEAGVVFHSFQRLPSMHPAIGYSDEVIHLYVAWDLDESVQEVEDEEFVLRERLPFARALEMVLSGEISDAKTAVNLLHAWRWWLREGPFPIRLPPGPGMSI